MPRARFSTGWGIRRDRKAQRGSGAGGAGVDLTTFVGILGSNLLVEYDARFLSSAGSWTDRRRGLLLDVLNPTAYAADGAFFGGLPVHQSAVGPPGGVLRTAAAPAPPILLTGDRPYLFCVLRARSTTGGYLLRVTNAGNQEWMTLNAPANQIVGFISNTSAPSAPFDLGVHAVELGSDSASGIITVAVDGAIVATSGVTGVSLATDTSFLSLGGSQNSTVPTNASFALVLFCKAVPSPTQRAQVLALAKSIWAF